MNFKSAYQQLIAWLAPQTEPQEPESTPTPPIAIAKAFTPPKRGRPRGRAGGGTR